MDNETVIRICIAAGLLNLVLVSGLAAGGVLHSVQTETRQIYVQESPEFRIELPADTDRPFVGELIVDADAYYNAVIRVENGASIYPPDAAYDHPYIQRYHYAPAVLLPFILLAMFGYGPFKLFLLITSIASVIIGSYIILHIENVVREFGIPNRKLLLISVASAGFGPMVSNYKVGQIIPFVYLAIAACWYWYRQGNEMRAGAALTLTVLTKPYFLAPAAILIAQKRLRGAVGVIGGTFVAYLVSIVIFGFDELHSYLRLFKHAALGEGTNSIPAVTTWGVEQIYPLFALGPITDMGRILAFVGFTALWIQYLRGGAQVRSGAGIFAGALVMMSFVVPHVSSIDLGVFLAAYLVLGAELYSHSRKFILLGSSFLLMTAHPYAMEILFGGGHPNVSNLVEGPLQISLQFLQPAAYGLYILAGLSVFVVLQPMNRLRDVYLRSR